MLCPLESPRYSSISIPSSRSVLGISYMKLFRIMCFNMFILNTKINIKILTWITLSIPPILPHNLRCYSSKEWFSSSGSERALGGDASGRRISICKDYYEYQERRGNGNFAIGLFLWVLADPMAIDRRWNWWEISRLWHRSSRARISAR